jgi:hypothetical protein
LYCLVEAGILKKNHRNYELTSLRKIAIKVLDLLQKAEDNREHLYIVDILKEHNFDRFAPDILKEDELKGILNQK